jgi:soluble lytic murein transglycosylase-like protein
MGALAGGRGLRLPFAVPLEAASFLLSLLLPVTGFLFIHIHHLGHRVKWWYLALAGLVILSLSYQTTTVQVFTAPQSQTFQNWSQLIEEASQKTGVSPALLGAVMLQESGGRAGAISYDPLGNPVAYGLMQLIPDTASRFGLPRQRILDPAENILAGAEYISELNRDFQGHTDLVLAGYYAGARAVQSALAKANLEPSLWTDSKWPKIAPYLPGVSPGEPTVEQYVQQVKQKLNRGAFSGTTGPAFLRD